MASTPGRAPTLIVPTPNPIQGRREENLNFLLTQAVRFVHLANTDQRVQRLKEILRETDREVVLTALRREGIQMTPEFETQDVTAILSSVQAFIREIERRAQVPEITTAFNKKLTAALERPEGASRVHEVDPNDPILKELKADFDRSLFVLEGKNVKPLPGERPADTLKRKQPDKSNLTWEDVVDKLNRPHWKNHEKTGIELVLAMQGGGELIGVEKGRLLFKDRGVDPVPYRGAEPVLFGFDAKDRPLMIYNRNEDQMKEVARYADYWETYEAVYGSEDKPTGYELFSTAEQYDKPESVSLLEQIRSKEVRASVPFIGGIDGGVRSTWLDNGRDEERTLSSVKTLDAREVEVPVGTEYRDVPIPRSDLPAESPTQTVRWLFKSGRSATYRGTSVNPNSSHEKLPTRGAVRLLKV